MVSNLVEVMVHWRGDVVEVIMVDLWLMVKVRDDDDDDVRCFRFDDESSWSSWFTLALCLEDGTTPATRLVREGQKDRVHIHIL
jgi:hypothetical protein